MQNTKIFVIKTLSILSISILPLSGCHANQAVNDATVAEKYISEGVDTKCEITGYTSYQGENSSYFLSKGDKIAVISPSLLPRHEQAEATVDGLAKWGFVPVKGKYVDPESRTMDDTIEDLEWALRDPEIQAIFCVRGGYGSSEIMDARFSDLLKDANKPIIGFSDITVYHCAWTSLGLPSISSSMNDTFTHLDEECAEAERRMMMGEIPSYRCMTDKPCIDGEAEGILIGGNLSTFLAVMNTEYDCTKTDKPYILFFEDIGENMEHIHRCLTVLKHMGVLDKASAIIFGEWTDIPEDDLGNFGKDRGGEFESVADMIHREFLVDSNIPIAFGFPNGHGTVNYPLLMGEKIHLKVSDGSYTIEWEPFSISYD